MHDYVIDSKQKRFFSPWKNRFGENLNFFSRVSDLSDKVLYLLAKPDDESAEALRELVMAVMDKGPVVKFAFLDDKQQWMIHRISMVILEQIYFEIMKRLGWIQDYACRRYSLVWLVENCGKPEEMCSRVTPVLSQSDPDFPEYIKLPWDQQKKYLESRFGKAFRSFEDKLKQAGIIPF